jgi:hypothetical protein
VNVALIVYLLCALTSLVCAILLARGYRLTRVRLLGWSALCFLGFFLNNALLVIDLHEARVDLSIWRTLPAAAGLALLVYGLVTDSHR